MKKILSVLAIMLAVTFCSVTFSSCSSDDDNDSFITNASFDVGNLYGTWDCDGYGGSTDGTYIWLSELDGTRITFRDNGSFSCKGLFGNHSASYTINRDIINVTPPKGASESDYIRIRVIKLEGNEAHFKLETGTGTSAYFSFKKR